MKLIVGICAMCCTVAGMAGTLGVKPLKLKSNSVKTDAATAKSKDVAQCKSYEIAVALNPNEVGKCRVVALTAVTSRSQSVKRITDPEDSYTYNYYTAKNSGAIFVPQSARIFNIPDGVQKIRLKYVTPATVFHEEKWNYIGDTSTGFKINGVAVYLIKEDGGDVSVLKTVCTSSTKDPITRAKKKITAVVDLPKWCVETKACEVEDKDLDWTTSLLEEIGDAK